MSRNRKPKVIWRKLGREDAFGQAWKDKKIIELDPRMTPKKQLEVICHEQLHITYPDMAETLVKQGGKDLCNILWRLNYREVVVSPTTKNKKAAE